MSLTKTGECNWRDAEGVLWLCESFVNENGVASSTQTLVVEEETPNPLPLPG